MKNISFGIIFFFVTLLNFPAVSAPSANSAKGDDIEYKLKAAFLLNFAKFTSWPAESDKKEAFTLCILGKNPFGSAFTGIESKHIAHRPVKILTTDNMNEVNNCQLIYVSNSKKFEHEAIISKFVNTPVLLVSDIDSFAEHGGIIQFVTIENRLRFKINLTKAKKAGLIINASLLDLAVTVY